MLLPFTSDLIVSNKYDCEMAALADRHYSRRTVGDRQFLPPGRTIVIRNTEGTLLFGWNWQYDWKRADLQTGYYCSIFRNESARLSSEVILECEQIAIEKWGLDRMYTFIDGRALRGTNPGYCFLMAGWHRVGRTMSGKEILVKRDVSARTAAP